MVQNVMGLIKDQLNDNLLGKMAGFLGENKSGVTTAVGSALPSLLLGFMKKGTEPGGAEGLFRTMQEGKHDSGILDNLDNTLDGGTATTNLLSSGKNMLGSIFGDKAGRVGDVVASAGGINKNSGLSLLGLLAPIVMVFLGKTLKSRGEYNAKGLKSLLLGQKDYVRSSLPSGVTNLLGVSDLDDLGREPMTRDRDWEREPARDRDLRRETMRDTRGPRKIWPWVLLLLAVLAAILLLWRSCAREPVREAPVQETVPTAPGTEEQTGAAPSGFLSKQLPNGTELNIPAEGVESKLIAFIEDTQRPVDDTTWFTFDRLSFETDEVTLKPESQEQLKNVAEILKAYPKVTLKIGGYTDNTGDPQANLRLSQQRAETVKTDLVGLGVDAGRLQAEGYGQEHPVADNSTEEGRAKNRRIDLQVTSK
jgi:outer membrane protein OmpA-like peptidoglycan-associated protein